MLVSWVRPRLSLAWLGPVWGEGHRELLLVGAAGLQMKRGCLNGERQLEGRRDLPRLDTSSSPNFGEVAARELPLGKAMKENFFFHIKVITRI